MRQAAIARKAWKWTHYGFAGGATAVGTLTVIFSDGLLSIPLASTAVTKYAYVRPASTVLSVYFVLETIPEVTLTVPPDCNMRYTLYPTTGDLLAVQEIVTECGLGGCAGAWIFPLCEFSQPARKNASTKEMKPMTRKARDRRGLLIFRNGPRIDRIFGSTNIRHNRGNWWTAAPRGLTAGSNSSLYPCAGRRCTSSACNSFRDMGRNSSGCLRM